MSRVRIALVAANLLTLVDLARGALPAELERLAFLLGQWESDGRSALGAGSGKASFACGLQDRVILRTSYALYPASAAAAARHDDLMVICVDDGRAVRADYYDNEGHGR